MSAFVRMAFRIDGKTAIVTGAAQGIGRSIADVLGENGANVVIADVNGEKAEKAAAELRRESTEALAVTCDVTSRKDAAALTDATLEEFDSVDVLVNNAGVAEGESFGELSPDEWQGVLDVNLTGMYNVSSEIVPAMAAQDDGRIVNVASIAGLNLSYEGPANYTASKWGVIGLTKHMAWDLGDDGIRVNALCPGGTLTPLIEQATTEESREHTREKIPAGRWAEPRDHGYAVLYLVSDEAAYVTGTTLVVDGGLTLSVRHEV
ncbi:SDR family NAD(P)-dependent oxidoreductase [Halegenticoccus soli]|uniref:SDR family NAD(P)-dependent oxidoreductase n=1 Tax=Halegenticoccus soli TaxID=1985678 RepID=UPI001179E1E8|nr:SDR family NAD(P)-dependent oxidoreductase [Halegenticoccus soli]